MYNRANSYHFYDGLFIQQARQAFYAHWVANHEHKSPQHSAGDAIS